MGAGGDGEGNGATVTVGAGGVAVGAGGVVGLEQAASAKPISITILIIKNPGLLNPGFELIRAPCAKLAP